MEKRTTNHMRLVAAIGRIPTMRRTGIFFSTVEESPSLYIRSTCLLIRHFLFIPCYAPAAAGNQLHLLVRVPGALRSRERKRHAMEKNQHLL